jgi:ubiquitin carboxyl-terminal hydrolase 8
MNACLSVLSHTYELHKLLDNAHLQARRKTLGDRKFNARLLDDWNELRNMLWAQNCTVAPGGFVSAVHRVSRHMDNFQFQGWNQSDGGEFLLFLLDAFHNALARSVVMRVEGVEKNGVDIVAKQCYGMMKQRYAKDYSEILDIFYGVQISIISDPGSTGALSANPEPFSVLDMVVAQPSPGNEGRGEGGNGEGKGEGKGEGESGRGEVGGSKPRRSSRSPITLHDCFDAYCARERLDGENSWWNEKTNQKQPVDKYLTFWSLPEVMIINLKRFSQTSTHGRYKKNTTSVAIPLHNVSFSKYVSGYNSEKYVYDLFGVCNHTGSTDGGHYTATVRVADGRWFNFDDASVSEVVNMPESHIHGTSPYCLFYRRRTTPTD